MHILIAPNAYKQSLSAPNAARIIKEGLDESKFKGSCECFPVGDGGDGTGELIVEKLRGRKISGIVDDPLGRPVTASFGFVDTQKIAVIEMASASGLRLIKDSERNPLLASSFGTGQLIRMALDEGAEKIIIAIGGSATVDGAAGILSALGVRFLREDGTILKGNPENLLALYSLDTSELDIRLEQTEIVVLCDVDNPLLGKEGAAAIFGPQKGASASEVDILETALFRLSEIIFNQTGMDIMAVKHGGAAGGAAAGLHAVLNARLVSGIDYYLDITRFDQSLEKASLVITGEGSIDEQTLQGKAPFGIAERACRRSIPVIALAGSIPSLNSAGLSKYFHSLHSIVPGPCDLEKALAEAPANLKRTARMTGNLLAL